ESVPWAFRVNSGRSDCHVFGESTGNFSQPVWVLVPDCSREPALGMAIFASTLGLRTASPPVAQSSAAARPTGRRLIHFSKLQKLPRLSCRSTLSLQNCHVWQEKV